jgi:excisionase family DNA binding protein
MPVVETPETVFPLALSPDSAADFLSISRRALSDLIADGTILAKKSGTRTLVSLDSLKAYFDGLPRSVPGSIPNAPQSHAPAPRKRRRRRS